MFFKFTTEQLLALAEALAAEVKVHDEPPLASKVREGDGDIGTAGTRVAASAIREPYIRPCIM